MRNRIVSLVMAAGLLLAMMFMGGCYPTSPTETPPAQGGTSGIAQYGMIIFLVLIFVLMYFLMIRPQRKKQQEHEKLVAEVRRGDKIITSGGIYGVIENTSEDSVVIKVESGATIRVARSSITVKRTG